MLLVVNAIGLVVCMGIMNPMIVLFEMNGVSYTLILYSIVLIIMMIAVMTKELCKKNLKQLSGGCPQMLTLSGTFLFPKTKLRVKPYMFVP